MSLGKEVEDKSSAKNDLMFFSIRSFSIIGVSYLSLYFDQDPQISQSNHALLFEFEVR